MLIHFFSFRALGILYVLLMKPFEDLLHKGSILELNEDLLTLRSTVAAWSKDGSLPMDMDGPVYPGTEAHLQSELGR
jgi:hypothetical protein